MKLPFLLCPDVLVETFSARYKTPEDSFRILLGAFSVPLLFSLLPHLLVGQADHPGNNFKQQSYFNFIIDFFWIGLWQLM